ncbi:MAG: PEP/pyruvate-binding domain-containing protein [candidate division KSB1 bacterium]|nr:PEP/pyruvate-binding domain-containing protein [candidate division KSB1 bacterium]
MESRYYEKRLQRVRQHLERHPHLESKILRQLLIELHTAGKVSVERIYGEAEGKSSEASSRLWMEAGGVSRLTLERRRKIDELIIRYAARHFSIRKIDKIVNLAVRREYAQLLEDFANLPNVSFDLLAARVREFCSLPRGEIPLPEAEALGIRAALIRQFVSDQLEFIGVAKHHLRICDFLPIVDRAIGPKQGIGKIGGKAAGMLLAYKILTRDPEVADITRRVCLRIPESYYLRSDLYQQFVQENGLMLFYDQKYKPLEEIRKEYPVIREIFKNGEFPPEIVSRFRELLEEVGTHPLIVRSSSLLEDNFGSAFSGKYESIFLPNQGTFEDRLQALMGAVAEVYASTLGPDPIAYRREKNLIDYDERMAVLIQKVVGIRYRHYFLPIWAGVGFSRNVYRWSPRIRREDGLVRIVMGLGTRAVDRVASDYPRLIALGAPGLRPAIEAKDLIRYSQHWVDVINLARNRVESITLQELLGDMSEPFPDLHLIVSVNEEGHVRPPATKILDAQPQDLVITFDRLATETDFCANLRRMLQKLESVYGSPVDVEFAYDGEALYLLQCRPQAARIVMERVEIPRNIPKDRVIFTVEHDAPNALIRGIEYIVYVRPECYDRLTSVEERLEVARIVSALNDKLQDKKFILMGPGRWGSNDIRLGVRVRYSDINHARVLVEVARQRDGYTPEVSFGTHFFQDLVETGIVYLPLYPDEPGVVFRESLLLEAANKLPELLPEMEDWADAVRVVHLPSTTDGLTATLCSDGEADRAVLFLERNAV